MYYRTCPECGSNLDPGEQCDCNEEKEFRKEESKRVSRMLKIEESGQMSILFEEAVSRYLDYTI